MREILVFGTKTFKIEVPKDARLTFGPFSPPPRGNQRGMDWSEGAKAGTLRVYGKTQKDILAVFCHVTGFRDLSVGYSELVAREEGASLWKSDEHGYHREEKVRRSEDWIDKPAGVLPPGEEKKRKK